MISRLLTLAFLTALTSCSFGIDKKELEKDAEMLANDKCQTIWVTTKLDRVTKHLAIIEDSLKISNLDERTVRRLTFFKFKRRDEIDYYTQQKQAYTNNNAEEEKKLRGDKYAHAAAWKRLNEMTEEILKKKKDSCIPVD